jgi:aminoglycoside 3-N-acetyltransferase
MTTVTRSELYNGLLELGLKPGDKLNIHSSLSSFGHLEGGAETLISVIQEIITEDGLLMMPTFTYGREPFDIEKTPSQTGKVTEVFRQMPDVIRSEHPTHSFAIWGKEKEKFALNHRTESAFDKNSPLYKLVEAGGKILFVGVDHTANSLIHVAQELADVDYIDRPKFVEIIESDGKISTMKVRRAGCSLGFWKLDNYLDQNRIDTIKIGDSQLQYFSAEFLLKTSVDLLKRDQTALFCDKKDCFACNEARELIKKAREKNEF